MLQLRCRRQDLGLLLAVHSLPHSQFPACGFFLFCSELQFPRARVKAQDRGQGRQPEGAMEDRESTRALGKRREGAEPGAGVGQRNRRGAWWES